MSFTINNKEVNLKNLKRKLSSRKFWMALIGFIVAVASAFGCPEIDGESVALIASGCVAVCAYVLGEGMADASGKREKDE